MTDPTADGTDQSTVYLAIDPTQNDPLFATTDFDVISEFLEASPDNCYRELGIVDGDEARSIIEDTYR